MCLYGAISSHGTLGVRARSQRQGRLENHLYVLLPTWFFLTEVFRSSVYGLVPCRTCSVLVPYLHVSKTKLKREYIASWNQGRFREGGGQCHAQLGPARNPYGYSSAQAWSRDYPSHDHIYLYSPIRIHEYSSRIRLSSPLNISFTPHFCSFSLPAPSDLTV
jgi:hypothetical protein